MLEVDVFEKTLSRLPHLFFIESFLADHPSASLFLVGGMVRDVLLDRPTKNADADFVVQHVSPQKIEIWFAKHGTIKFVGASFGVYQFMPNGFHDGQIPPIDIALPRTEHAFADSEGGYKDVSVKFDPELPIEQDLERRDFTINAMAYDIRNKTLIDPFFGKKDLLKKVIRTVGEPKKRFHEDLTRLLRAIRFACELSFEIEPETTKALSTFGSQLMKRKRVDGTLVPIISKERKGKELVKALRANPSKCFALLQQTDLFSHLFPRVPIASPNVASTLQNLPPHQTELACLVLFQKNTDAEIAAMYELTGLGTTPNKHLALDEITHLIQKLQHTPKAHDIQFMRASQFEKWFLGRRGALLSDALHHLQQTEVVAMIKKRREEICARWICEEDEPIPPLLTGDDVLASGVSAGPRVRDLLELLRDLQLDGTIMTRDKALQWLKTETTK